MTIERLNALYTAFAKASKADPSMEDQARAPSKNWKAAIRITAGCGNPSRTSP